MNYFVYVVCGDEYYIEQLNVSLRFLRYHSKYPILVVTDLNRNKGNITHDTDHIIHVETPVEMSNNEASIFLETSLLQHLPSKGGEVFCYLDSDVIAVSEEINHVFNEIRPWPRFAPDHCDIDHHSPHAMTCSCIDHFAHKSEAWHYLQNVIPGVPASQNSKREALAKRFKAMKSRPLRYFPAILWYVLRRYVLPVNSFHMAGFRFDKKTHCWYDGDACIDFDKAWYHRKIRRDKGFVQKANHWYDSNGNLLRPETPHCSHLREFLSAKEGLEIPADFRHWNGGVFLFDRASEHIMQTWHQLSCDLMKNKQIRTKYIDQVSLIMTAFRYGFHDKAPLPVKYNFITDAENSQVAWHPDKGYTCDGFNTVFHPAFLHVYHHWGKSDWSIWQSVKHHGLENKIITKNDLKNPVLFSHTE